MDSRFEDIQVRLQPHMRRRTFSKGHMLHGPDNPSFAFHTILSGKVRFTNVSERGDFLDMFVLGPPHSFGDISLLSGMTPPHMALVEERAEIGIISQKKFRQLIDKDDVVRDWLLWRLSKRLSSAYLALDAIRRNGARERILRYLRWLAANGFASDDGKREVPITQAELASRLGLSRATTSATLKALERDGQLKCHYGKIHVATPR